VCVACVVFARYGHPLRFYITPHFAKCRAVAPLKLHLVPHTASRPSGLQNRRYAKWPSLETVAQPSALPGRWRALRTAVCAPLWVCLHLGISQALRAVLSVSGLRPVAWCVPPPTRGPRRCAALAPRWTARPPPTGAPSVSAKPGAAALTRRLVAKSTRPNGKKYRKSSYIHPYIALKKKDPATYSIARSSTSIWGG
jgi:hypothetical protein